MHLNVTAHPTAAWTLQQLREALGDERRYRYLIHDRDRIYAKRLDESIERLGLQVLKSPLRSPMANAICKRVIGMSGLADSNLRGAPAIDPQNLGRPLQQVASSYVAWTGCARTATESCRIPDSANSTSDSRGPRHAWEIGVGRAPSRVLVGVGWSMIRCLRTTGGSDEPWGSPTCRYHESTQFVGPCDRPRATGLLTGFSRRT